ncbi:hypothetical protein BGZ94_006234 [Podila epigama]|nr:hypothetical protein BGZ94_006234 [Podila epigama]
MTAALERLIKFSDRSSAESLDVISDANATFTLYYWGIPSAGATARDLLSYGRVSWKNHVVDFNAWAAGEFKTPFRALPILKIRSVKGHEVTLAETIVVDQFLAKRFNLLGDNEWEEYQIKAFYSNIHYLRERSFQNVSWTHADKRKVGLEKFLTKTLPAFIEDHEFHLKNNGSNGHYIGNRLSLADIHLANIIDHFAALPSGEVTTAMFKKSTPLWRVKEEVEKDLSIRNWRDLEEYRAFAKSMVEVYSVTAVQDDEDNKEDKKE